MRKLKCQKKNGQALVLSYMVIVSMIALTTGLLTKAMSEKNIADRSQLMQEVFFMAEGANESAIAAFTSAMANFQIAIDIQTYSAATTFTTFGSAVVNTTIRRLESSDQLTTDSLGRNVYIRHYEVFSTATHPQNSAITITVHQIIARRLIPTFQHMVFYDDDLEILPGANMGLSGRIHTNQDLYIGSRATLTVDSNYLRAAGSVYNERKDDPTDIMAGNVDIRVTKTGSPKYEAMAGLDSQDSDWYAESTDRWNGTVQDAAHGITSLTAPNVGTTAPNGYYNNNAQIVIQDNDIYRRNGSGTLQKLTENVDYPAGTVTTTSTSFYNNREGQYIRMTTVDMAKLAGTTGSCTPGPCANNLPSNGLLYATRTDATGGDEPGIKLTNGAEVASPSGSGGLTVVSNQPVYIKGDYNTTNEKPAAVIADSVNLLSNNWSDANSALGLSSRPATATTVNTAFVAGVKTTTASHYNGGLENYPRLHENWSGTNLNIKGSFVELWNSSVATGDWAYGGSQYTAPNRNWTYNTNFNNAANLPPFTPWAVEAQRVAWWTE